MISCQAQVFRDRRGRLIARLLAGEHPVVGYLNVHFLLLF